MVIEFCVSLVVTPVKVGGKVPELITVFCVLVWGSVVAYMLGFFKVLHKFFTGSFRENYICKNYKYSNGPVRPCWGRGWIGGRGRTGFPSNFLKKKKPKDKYF